MEHIINLAIQVLPTTQNKPIYDIVDDAIGVIEKSGLKYKVCPFETVIEGAYDQVMEVVKLVQQTCIEAGAESLITNIKIQVNASKDVYIEDKIGKYQ